MDSVIVMFSYAVASVRAFAIVLAVVVCADGTSGGTRAGNDSLVVVVIVFDGDFFFLVTWVHRSPVLFGWYPGSKSGLVLFLFLLSLLSLLVLLFVNVFFGLNLARWPNCLQDEQSAASP